jgi:CO/xanthine dehydrogenase Mo-binding subunit
LRGRGRYTADLTQGARILRFVRSPVARGRILAVNSSPEMPIITAAGLVDVRPICPLLDRPDYVPVAQPILADDRVTYVGEPIAAVIADTAAEAEDFAEEVTVEIAAETPVVTLDQALAPGAPLVHDMAAQNTLIDARFETPDVAAAFAAAQQVVEFTFTSGRQAAVPLETRGAVAAFDPGPAASPSLRQRKCRTCCAPASLTPWGFQNPNCASWHPRLVAVSDRRCPWSRSTWSWCGRHGVSPAPSPGSRTGLKI